MCVLEIALEVQSAGGFPLLKLLPLPRTLRRRELQHFQCQCLKSQNMELEQVKKFWTRQTFFPGFGQTPYSPVLPLSGFLDILGPIRVRKFLGCFSFF